MKDKETAVNFMFRQFLNFTLMDFDFIYMDKININKVTYYYYFFKRNTVLYNPYFRFWE